jgi:hypothetical protein
VFQRFTICDARSPKELPQDRIQSQAVWDFPVLLPLQFKLPSPKLKNSCRHVRPLNHAIHLLLSYVNFCYTCQGHSYIMGQTVSNFAAINLLHNREAGIVQLAHWL